jgi:hypothetical protein
MPNSPLYYVHSPSVHNKEVNCACVGILCSLHFLQVTAVFNIIESSSVRTFLNFKKRLERHVLMNSTESALLLSFSYGTDICKFSYCNYFVQWFSNVHGTSEAAKSVLIMVIGNGSSGQSANCMCNMFSHKTVEGCISLLLSCSMALKCILCVFWGVP